jgi:hypothetical protein
MIAPIACSCICWRIPDFAIEAACGESECWRGVKREQASAHKGKESWYKAPQLLVEAPSGRVFVMMARSMQTKSGGRGASMDLGFGVAGLVDEARVYGVRK